MASQLRIDNVAFSYGEKTIFSGLNLEVSRGEILCVLGANGCGKTTFLRCINGALKLKAGQISLDDVDIASLGVLELARKIGIVFQEHDAPFPFSVLEVVRMGRAPHLSFFGSPSHRDTEIALDALELVGMSHLKDKPYTQISGGERQLVLIARTLAQEPAVILLDEPTSHLDFKNQALVLRMIDRLSKTGLITMMSTHLPNHAFLFSSKVALMNHGKLLAFGHSAEVMTEDNLYLTYDIDVKILTVDYSKGGETVKFCIPKMETEKE